MDDFDFYGEADTWCTVFLLPDPESTAFCFKLLPILVKNKAKNFMEKKKSPKSHVSRMTIPWNNCILLSWFITMTRTLTQKAVSPSAWVSQTPNNLFQTRFKSPVSRLMASLEDLLHLMSTKSIWIWICVFSLLLNKYENLYLMRIYFYPSLPSLMRANWIEQSAFGRTHQEGFI